MYKNEVKKILLKELKSPLTLSGIKIILLRNECLISKPRLSVLANQLNKSGFLKRETTRNEHPKRKPIYLFSLNN